MKILLGFLVGLEGELVRKTFIERKCATVPPSDRIDCGYEGKPVLDYKLFLGQMAQGNSRAAQIITGS